MLAVSALSVNVDNQKLRITGKLIDLFEPIVPKLLL